MLKGEANASPFLFALSPFDKGLSLPVFCSQVKPARIAKTR
jgi:hypothetical protein